MKSRTGDDTTVPTDNRKPLQSAPRPRRVRSADLFGSDGQLIIEHGGREYRLRVTNSGKLILTA
jgi:hemin uptake protein HemP